MLHYSIAPEIEPVVHLLRRGDDNALEQAMALLQDTVFSFSMRVCGPRQDAEGTMQEAPQPDLSLEELMPNRKKLQQLETDGGINPESVAIRSEEAGRLRKIIQRLPPQYRIVLVLRDMEGLKDEEVAEVTGLRPGTVRVRLRRARLFVRKELMKGVKRPGKAAASSRAVFDEQPRPGRCKAMLAELSDYLDGKLDDSLCEELERHLKGCKPCQAFLASLKSTVEQCRRSPVEGLDRKRAARLHKKVLADYELVIGKKVRR